jgi:hypothetical protein
MTKIKYLDQKLQFIYPQAPTKHVQATGEGFSPQKRMSSTFKTLNFFLFFYFAWVIFASWIRIRLPNADPDPQHWVEATLIIMVPAVQ